MDLEGREESASAEWSRWRCRDERKQGYGSRLVMNLESSVCKQLGGSWELTIVKHRLHLHDVRSRAGCAVDAFYIETEQINSLDTLVHDHGHGGVVTPEEFI